MKISKIAIDTAEKILAVTMSKRDAAAYVYVQHAIDEATEELRRWIITHAQYDSTTSAMRQSLGKIEFGISPEEEGDLITDDDAWQDNCPTCKWAKLLSPNETIFQYHCQYPSSELTGFRGRCHHEPIERNADGDK